MRQAVAGLVALLAAAASLAHPHTHVDQQAHIVLGRTEAVITYNLSPSSKDGGLIFDQIDTDRNGQLSRREQRAFAATLLARSKMTLDGARVALTLTEVAFPVSRAMTERGAAIRIKARAALRLGSARPHRIVFEINHSRFARLWLIQPYYRSELLSGRKMPTLRRNPRLNAAYIDL